MGPYLQRIRSFFRFSLRSLLVAMTIVCVALGTWIRSAVEQHQTVKQLTAGKATVLFDYQYKDLKYDKTAQPLIGGWLQESWRLYLFHSVTQVSIGAMFHHDTYDRNGGESTYDDDFLISEETYSLLKSLKLKSLSLCAANMSNDELKHIAQIRTLEELTLDAVPIDGDGLAHLARLPRLKSLSLWQTRLADENLDGLLKIRTLKGVSVGETFVTPAGAERVRNAMPECKVHY